MRCELSATPSLHDGDRRVRADDRNAGELRGLEGQKSTGVAEQHHRARRRTPRQGTVFRQIVCLFVSRDRSVEQAGLLVGLEHAPGAVIDSFLRNPSFGDRSHQLLAEVPHGPGHLEIEPRLH